MKCIMEAFKLFEGNGCAAATLAAMSFVLGLAAACLACGLRRACGGRCPARGARPARKQADAKPFEKRKPHPAPADGSVEIYVGNLSYEMTEAQVRQAFEAYGTVNSVRLITNRINGKSKGFGFVNMPDRAAAEKACAALNDTEVMGRRMKCNEAKNLV